MTSAEMLTELREVLADEIPAYGFSDVRALAYLNEGQQKFCEDTGFFTDRRTFTVTLVPGTSSYKLDDRIIKVYDAFIGARCLSKRMGLVPSGEAPEPFLWQVDAETGYITMSPVPTAAATVQLHAWRYPLADLKVAATAVDPEIPKRMHRACIEWAAYKCYGHLDIELANTAEALKHRDAYRSYVLEGREAKANIEATDITVGGNPCYQV